MAEIKIDSKSLKVIVKMQEFNKATVRGMRQAWFKVGKDLIKTANDHILATDKSGILYGVVRRGGKKRLVKLRPGLPTHRASAPGQPPANLNSDLRKSLGFKIRGAREMAFSADTPYAGRLERGGGAIEPRPYLLRSVRDNERNIQRHFKREIARAIEKGFKS